MLSLFPFALGKGKARALWTRGPLLGGLSFALHGELGEAACHPRRPPLHARSASAQGPAPPRPSRPKGRGAGEVAQGPSCSLSGLVSWLAALLWESVGGF